MIKILEGENSFLSKQRLDSLIQKYSKEKPNSSIKIIDAESKNISDIINEYETQDIFSKNKLLVIKRLILNKNYKDFVEKIIDTKNYTKDIDLIIWEEKAIPKNTRYHKLFKEIDAIESFTKFNKRNFQTWAKEYVKLKKLKMDETSFKILIEMTDYNPYLFANEIEKLKLSEKENINAKDLEENTNDMFTNNIWDFLDAINQKSNMEEYTKILINLLKNGLDPHYLMIMIARNVKQILLIKKMTFEGKTDREIVSILKIPPFTLPKLKNIASKSESEKLLSLYEKLYNLNYESKIGNIDAELGLILLITRLN